MRVQWTRGFWWTVLASVLALGAGLALAESRGRAEGFMAVLDGAPDSRGQFAVQRLLALPAAPAPVSAQLNPLQRWRLRLLGEEGQVLTEIAVADPTVALIGAGPTKLPLAVRFPNIDYAILAELRDVQGRLRAEIALDEASRGNALAGLLRTRGAQLAAVGNEVPDPDAAAALARQLAFESRKPGARKPCAWVGDPRVPETVVARECTPPAKRGASANKPLPAAKRSVSMLRLEGARMDEMLVSPAPAPETVEVASAKVPASSAATTVRVSGRVVFPSASTPPAAPFTLRVFGVDGNPYAFVPLQVAPPDFRFEQAVSSGVRVRLEAEPPVPFLKAELDLGELAADTSRDLAVEQGIRLKLDFALPAGAAAPTEGLSVYLWGARGDGDRYDYVWVDPAALSAEVAIKPGASVRAEVRPPSPFLRMQAHLGPFTADAQRQLTLVRGAEAVLRFRPPDGMSMPGQAFAVWMQGLFDAEGSETRWSYQWAAPPDFIVRAAVKPGSALGLRAEPGSPYLPVEQRLARVDADLRQDITLRRGAQLSGRLRVPVGMEPPNAVVQIMVQAGNRSHWLNASPPDFAFATAVEPGAQVGLQLFPPAPYLIQSHTVGEVAADRVLDLRLQRGVKLSGRVRALGALPSTSQAHVMDARTGTSIYQLFNWSEFEVAVPPVGGVVEVLANGFMVSAPFQPQAGEDASHEFLLEPAYSQPNVVLTLWTPDARPVSGARIEAWREGRYFAGATAAWGEGNEARLNLPDGDYELRIWADSEQGNIDHGRTRLFGGPALVRPISVAGAARIDITLPAERWIPMYVPLAGDVGWAGPCVPRQPLGRFELLKDGAVVARGPLRHPNPAEDARGHALILPAGQWRLRYWTPSDGIYESDTFTAAAGGQILLRRLPGAPLPKWRGVLRDHLGAPVAAREIAVTDEIGVKVRSFCPLRTDGEGRFELPVCAGCAYEFKASKGSPALRRIVELTGPAQEQAADLRLGHPLAFASVQAGSASRILGDADAPLRILFLAEGYTEARETYTDSNGNGVWDGVQYVDVNGNGVWNDGEPYARYGNSSAPVSGIDPRTQNEVIQDQNGDGVLSLDDRALFESNVQDYLRALLSAHVFDRYRHAYQASALLLPSRQAGMDHGANWQRDTRFNAAFQPDRSLLGIDYSAALAEAAAADPNYDVIVVMINQPVPYGRVNSFVLAGGGMLAGDVNDLVSAHEFGHNPGRLADEYSEYISSYSGASPVSANSTRFVQRAMVPWGMHIPVAADGQPSRDYSSRSGFFEGSSYYMSGAFRPSQDSVMRYYWQSFLFNPASVDQLESVHRQTLRGRAGLLALAAGQDCRSLRVSWDARGRAQGAVELRRDGPQGALLARGGEQGEIALKSVPGELFLLDAEGAVLDIEGEPPGQCLPPAPPPDVR